MTDNNDDDNSGKGGHLRVVELQTADEKRKEACVLKLRELLAQAEQGKYLDMAFIGVCGSTDHQMHWTHHLVAGSQQLRIIGALQVMQHVFLGSIPLTKS